MRFFDTIISAPGDLIIFAKTLISFKLLPMLSAEGIDVSEIASGDADGGMLKEVVSGTKKTLQDTYTLIMVAFIFLAVIMGIIGAMKLGFSGNSNTKQDAKGSIGWLFVAIAIGCGMVAIVALIQTIGVGMSAALVE